MKTLLKSMILCFSVFAITTASAQEDTIKVKKSTTTIVTEEETIVSDSTVKVAPPVQPTPAEAPENDESSEWKGFHVGGVVQSTFTDIKVDGANGTLKTSYVVGYGGGGFIGYFFSSHVETRVEVLYSSLAQEIVENDVKRKLKLSYVNIPLLVAFHTGYDRTVSFNVTAGPQIGINTGSSLEGEGSDGIDTVQATVKFKPADIGIAYGAGLDFGIGPKRLVHFNIGFRGVYGILDISDNSKNLTTDSYYILDRAQMKTYSGYAGLSVKF